VAARSSSIRWKTIWQYLRANWLSNRVFETFDEIIDAFCDAWNKLVAQPETMMRQWAHVGHTPSPLV